MGWHQVNRQKELVMEEGGEAGEGRDERSSATGDGGHAATSLTPDVDRTQVHIFEIAQLEGSHVRDLLYSYFILLNVQPLVIQQICPANVSCLGTLLALHRTPPSPFSSMEKSSFSFQLTPTTAFQDSSNTGFLPLPRSP